MKVAVCGVEQYLRRDELKSGGFVRRDEKGIVRTRPKVAELLERHLMNAGWAEKESGGHSAAPRRRSCC